MYFVRSWNNRDKILVYYVIWYWIFSAILDLGQQSWSGTKSRCSLSNSKGIWYRWKICIFFFWSTSFSKNSKELSVQFWLREMYKYMWNSGFHLLWSHISNLYNENLNYGLKFVPKLTYEHISLSPYSVMNVLLAAQVLNDSVGNVLLSFCSPDSYCTSNFC